MAESIKTKKLSAEPATAFRDKEAVAPAQRLDLGPRPPLEPTPLSSANAAALKPVAHKGQKLAQPKAASRWQAAPPLGEIGPWRLNYRMGDIAAPLNEQAGPNSAIRIPVYSAVFGQKERDELDVLLAKGQNFNAADWNRLNQIVDSPDKWAALWGNPFLWADNHRDVATYSPLEVVRLRAIVCRDWHTGSSSGLRSGGRGSVAYAYYAPGGIIHAFSIDQNQGGSWDGREYSAIHATRESTSLRSFMHMAPDALRILEYEISADPNVRPIPRRIIETQAGLEIKRFFTNQMLPHAGIAALDAQDAHDGLSARASVGSNGSSAAIQAGMLDINLHSWAAPTQALNGIVDSDPMLRNAFGASVGFRPWRNVRLSVGSLSLPEAYNYSIGPRLRTSQPLFILFAGMQLQTPVLVLARNQADTLQWKLSGSYARTKNRTFLTKLFWYRDYIVEDAITHEDIMARTEVSWQARQALQLWASTSAYVPAEILRFRSKYGKELFAINYSVFSEAGAIVGDSKLAAYPSVYMPWLTMSNVFAADPHWQVPVFARVGKNASFAAVVDGSIFPTYPGEFIRSAYAGFKAMGAGIFAGVHTFNQAFYPYTQLSLDLGELVQSLVGR